MASVISRHARLILIVTTVFTAVSFALGGTVVSRLKSGASIWSRLELRVAVWTN